MVTSEVRRVCVVTDLRGSGGRSLVYGLSGAAPQLVGLVTLPIVARSLTTSDYGVLELAVVSVGLVAILAGPRVGIGEPAELLRLHRRPGVGAASAAHDRARHDDGESRASSATSWSRSASQIARICCSGRRAEAAVVVWMAVLLLRDADCACSPARSLRLHSGRVPTLVSSVVAAAREGRRQRHRRGCLRGRAAGMLAGRRT